MKTWKVIRNCHAFGRYWEDGKIVEFEDDVIPPRHFQSVGEVEEKKIPSRIDPMKPTEIVTDKAALSSLPTTNQVAKGGFASSVPAIKPERPKTAAQAFKHKK